MPRRPLISIVDDDESVREAIKGLLRSVGLAANTYPSARVFLTSSAIGKTACLIADITMPDMTGLELHRHAKAMGRQIPTVLITAYPSDTGREQALKSGVLAYLTKPFSDHDLLDCIRSALGSTYCAAHQLASSPRTAPCAIALCCLRPLSLLHPA